MSWGGSKLNKGTTSIVFSLNDKGNTFSKSVQVDHDVKCVGIQKSIQSRSSGNITTSVSAEGNTITVNIHRNAQSDGQGDYAFTIDYWY